MSNRNSTDLTFQASEIVVSTEDRKEETKKASRPRLMSLNSSLFDVPSATPAQVGMWKILRRQQKTRDSSIELALHIVFTSIFITIICLQRSVWGSYLMNQGLAAALVNQQIDFDLQPFPTTFYSVSSMSQIADYLVDVVAGTLDSNTYYNGDPFPADQSTYIQGNRLIGGIRIRQLKVSNSSCPVPKQMQDIAPACYDLTYSDSTKETRPFGPKDNITKYTYSTQDESGSAGIWGSTGNYYEGGGYVVDFPLGSNFTSRMQELIDDLWFDISTRAIIVSLSTANADLDSRIAVLYLVFEMPAGGVILPTSESKVFRLNVYMNGEDYFRAVIEVIFVLMLGYWIYEEVKEYRKTHEKKNSVLAYFKSLWNLIEIVNLLAFVVTVIMYIIYLGSRERDVDLAAKEYLPKLEGLAADATNYYNISAFNILMCAFRTFKYFRLNDRMFVLWKALRVASGDLFSFLVMFFILLIGFLLFGLISFGADVGFFSTFAGAWGSCWNFVLGNPPDYFALSESNRVLGPMYFLLFTVFIFFIMVNMFIAILNDALNQVHKTRPPSKGVAHAITRRVKRMASSIKNLTFRKQMLPIKKLIEGMKDPAILNNAHITLEDMKTAIGPGATDSQAKELIDIHEKLHNGEYDPELMKDVPLALKPSASRSRASLPDSDRDDDKSSGVAPMDNSSRDDDAVANLTAEVARLHAKIDALTDLILQQQSKKTV